MTIPFFDATAHAPATGTPDPVPVGNYVVQVAKIEKKLNSQDQSGKQWGLSAQFTIVDGPYKGQMIFENYNLANANDTTVRIANEQFSALCHVTGVLKPRDPSELVGKAFQVKVKIEKGSNGYSDKNKITQYLRVDGSKLGGVAGATAPAAPKVAQKAPWSKAS